MTSSDINVDLIINKLSEQQYLRLSAEGKIDDNQLYLVPDDGEYYKKSETSSAIEIQDAFDNIPKPDMSEYYKKSETSSDIEIAGALSGCSKISVDDAFIQNFKFLHISYEEYAKLVSNEQIDPLAVYVLSGDGYASQFGKRITDVGSPELSDDAATKQYVDDEISKIPAPDTSKLRDKTDLSVYSSSGNSWDLPDGFIIISEATKTGGKFIFIAVGTFGNAYSKEEYDTAEQRSQATCATFVINGNDIVVQRTVSYVPTGDTLATNSSLINLSSQVNPSESNVTASGEYYRVYADKMNNLTSVSDHMKIVLDNYDFSKSYVMKFNTPQNSEIRFDFYVDNGSGPSFDSGMNINKSYSFPMNSGYVIEVKFDAMDIRPLAWNGDRQKMVFRTIEWIED